MTSSSDVYKFSKLFIVQNWVRYQITPRLPRHPKHQIFTIDVPTSHDTNSLQIILRQQLAQLNNQLASKQLFAINITHRFARLRLSLTITTPILTHLSPLSVVTKVTEKKSELKAEDSLSLRHLSNFHRKRGASDNFKRKSFA